MENLLIKLGLVESKEEEVVVLKAEPIPILETKITQDINTSAFDEAFKKLNTPEFDLYEYIKGVESFNSTKEAYINMFQMGKTLNPSLTKELLLGQVDQYLNSITGAASEKTNQAAKSLEQKSKDLVQLQEEVRALEVKYKSLTSGLQVFTQKFMLHKQNIQNL